MWVWRIFKCQLLIFSNLEKSQLNNSDLSIDPIFANFSNSNLYASTQGANCNNANFENANLAKVNFEDQSIYIIL